MARYLLDANVFIQAKNLYYGFDIVPAFWAWLDDAHADDNVASIRPVLDELAAGNDELAEWAKERKLSWGADCLRGTLRYYNRDA